MIECKYLKDKICLLASELAKKDILVPEKTCNFCTNKAIPSQSINEVIVSISITNNKDKPDLQNNIREKYGHLLVKEQGVLPEHILKRFNNVMSGNGVGSQLWKLLEKLGIKHQAGCDCLFWAEMMNRWGPIECQRFRKEIIRHMKDGSKNYGWGDVTKAATLAITTGLAFKINLLDVFGSLLDEAIRLSSKTEEKKTNDLVDIVIPLGNASRYNNLEIQMSLRSIEKYAMGYRKVIIISPNIPKFLYENSKLQLIQKKEYRCNKQSRVQRKIEWAITHLDITDDFVYWNDDFLMLKPFDVRQIPNYISGQISLLKQSSGWRESKRRTGQILNNFGKSIDNYDIHVPIIFNKNKHLSLRDWWHKPSNQTPLMRSLYGNHFCHNNEKLRDVKLQKRWKSAIDNIIRSDRWIISYGDGALRSGFDKWMKNKFPNKSFFEKKHCIDCNEKVDIDSIKLMNFWKSKHINNIK